MFSCCINLAYSGYICSSFSLSFSLSFYCISISTSNIFCVLYIGNLFYSLHDKVEVETVASSLLLLIAHLASCRTLNVMGCSQESICRGANIANKKIQAGRERKKAEF